MAGQRGRDVLIKISDGGDPEAFITLAGIRTSQLDLNQQRISGSLLRAQRHAAAVG